MPADRPAPPTSAPAEQPAASLADELKDHAFIARYQAEKAKADAAKQPAAEDAMDPSVYDDRSVYGRQPAADCITARDALEAVLLFHSASPCDEGKRERWSELTGVEAATTRVLCDMVRTALASSPPDALVAETELITSYHFFAATRESFLASPQRA